MQSLTLILCLISTCYCAVEFYERPRNFSIELLYFTQLETRGHVLISPYGIWTLITGITFGTSQNSYKQLSQALRLPKNLSALGKGYRNLVSIVQESTKNGIYLSNKNYIFIDKDFVIYPSFKNSIEKNHGTIIKELDFNDARSAQIANKFIEHSAVEEENVLRPDDFTSSGMILVNVIRFRGLWSSPFNVKNTRIEPFYDENIKEIGRVNMMYQRGQFLFSDVQSLNAFALELPYGVKSNYFMLVLLPYKNTVVTEIYKKLTVVSLKNIYENLKNNIEKNGVCDVDVKLPRFKISTNLIMNKPLYNMGVVNIFQPNLANFQRMIKEEIFLSAVVHKADIEVSESGTVAPALSAVKFSKTTSARSFYANRPFLYFIMERSTLSIIFSGIYSQPSIF